MPSRIRVLLVDDNLPLRSGMRAMLRTDPAFEVVGEAGDGALAVRLAADLAPDAIVMDVQMPGMNGIEATRQIIHTSTDRDPPAVIALSGSMDDTQSMLNAGAVRFVPKSQAHDIGKVIKHVLGERGLRLKQLPS